MKKILLLTLFTSLIVQAINSFTENVNASTGDTTIVQTLRFDTTMRAGVFHFPDDSTKSYEKIIMHYRMRCKNGLISTTTDRNKGCGEWDYNCYTYIVDSSQTDSLKRTIGSYVITNNTDSFFYSTNNPVWSYVQYTQQAVTYDSIISEITATPGNGVASLSHPLSPISDVQRSQYLWKASELTSSGLVAGNITGLQLQILSTGSAVENLRIRIKKTTQDSLSASSPETDGFTTVYFLNTPITSTGIISFNFSTPFNWDGTSNLIVEFTYSLPATSTGNLVEGHTTSFPSGLITNQGDSWISFSGNRNFLKPDSSWFSSVTDKITIAFWANGDSTILPANTSIIYGEDYSNNKQVNIHLPWSDSNIYWDCGGVGSSYDRINKLDSNNIFRGRWNFWAFTKNAISGEMKIFLNGHLWMSDTGKTRLIDLKKLMIGSTLNGGNAYRGLLDEVSIWNKDLDSLAIQSIMFNDITPAHPDYAFLKTYYKLNESSGNVATDSSPNGYDAELINPSRKVARGNDLHRNFTSTTNRPDITFVKGVYTTTTTNYTVLDSSISAARSVISYSVVNNSLVVLDTTYVWPAGNNYIRNSSGTIVDTVVVATQDTIDVDQLQYYDKRPMYVELLNFITPYGINLDLDGLNGKDWEIDVTDFAPVLKGDRYLAMEDGKYQEQNDIYFVFYEGTPPRNVKSISQIWPSGSWVSPSYQQINSNEYFEPRSITLSPNASQYKIRSAISGHGQQGEFISRFHTISLNGTTNFSRAVWTECATNPVYPQGGTWVYDRAGWCPGAAVILKEFELTPSVTPGQTVTLDYTLPFNANPGASNYRVNNQLVSYGDPNFTTDASVHSIVSPSKRVEFTRTNPLCDDPIIVIRNTGSAPLTSLDINYGRDGGTMSTFQWTGNLNFLDTDLVTLPAPNWLTSPIERFVVTLSNPNGVADQYNANDTMSSAFAIPDLYVGGLVFEFKTNNLPNNNSYTIKNESGVTMLNRVGAAANTTYSDTLNLPAGCYKIYMTDNGDDGLSFWANTSQGTGFFRIRSSFSGTILKTFNPDFGDNINYQFTMNFTLPVEEIAATNPTLTIYPNPASANFLAEISGGKYSVAKVVVTDMLGQVVLSENVRLTSTVEKLDLNASEWKNGVYFVTMENHDFRVVRKLIIQH